MIEPYYQSEKVTLYCGDCLSILPTLSGVDFIFADPPYGVGFEYANSDDSRDGYVTKIPLWFAAMAALGARSMAVTPGMVNTCHWPQPRWLLAWMKTNSMGASFLSGPNAVSRNLWEPVLWYGQYPQNPPSRDTIIAPICPSDRSDHPCPKPVDLLVRLVEAGTDEGETVLDPFTGSGTTGVAAVRFGRSFIGIDRDEGYCAIAKRRIQEAEQAFALFEPSKPEQQGEMFNA